MSSNAPWLDAPIASPAPADAPWLNAPIVEATPADGNVNAPWLNAPIAGTPPAEAPADRPWYQSALRGAGQVASGFVDSVGEAVGFVPDAVAAGLRQVHPSLAPSDPRYYRDKVLGGIDAVESVVPDFGLGSQAPESREERALRGAGSGLGDVATFLAPGMGLAKAAQAGSLAARVGQMASKAPKSQLAAGAVGGAVREETGSPLAGAAAGMVVPGAVGAARAGYGAGKAVAREIPGAVRDALNEGWPSVVGRLMGGGYGASLLADGGIGIATGAAAGLGVDAIRRGFPQWLNAEINAGRMSLKDAAAIYTNLSGAMAFSEAKRK